MNIGTKLTMEYLAGVTGMEDEAGDGISIVSHEDGGMQLAIYWTEDDGQRHTVHIAEHAPPKLLLALADNIKRMSEHAKVRREGIAMMRIRPLDEPETRH